LNPSCRRLLIAFCLLFLAACGPSSEESNKVRVAASEFRFEPANLALKPNVATTLTFKNAGQTLHDLTIVSGPNIPTPDTPASGDHMAEKQPYHVVAEAGKEATLALNLPAGSYTFICSVAGHKELGMQGTISVQ
jgi:plastocyanin